MVWSAIAAVASVCAAVAALVTVRLTIGYRREERLRHLAEALINVVVVAEDHPGPNGPDLAAVASGDLRLREALRQLDRVAALSLLGLSAQISDPIVALMDPSVRRDPDLAFALSTKAYERLLADAGRRQSVPTKPNDGTARLSGS